MRNQIKNTKNLKYLLLPLTLLFLASLSLAQSLAPGAPGKDAQWASAGKQGVGTSVNLESKVWFTLQGGVLTEVYYPSVAVGNVHLLQFIVVNPKSKKVETERDDATHEVQDYYSKYYEYQLKNKDKPKTAFPSSPLQDTNPDSMAALRFYQINTAKSGEWKITKDYVTDPIANTVLINVQFESQNKDLELYVYYDPSLSNSGMHDTAWNEGQVLLSKDGEICSALTTNSELTEISNGYYQISDGIEQLRKAGKITTRYNKAENGNVAQIAKVGSKGKNQGLFTLALGFGKTSDQALNTARASLKKGFVNPFNDYVKGWSDYIKTLRKVDPKYQAQFNMAAMVLKAHEDKTNRGANIASLSVPWGGGDNANEDNVGGYHLVWARDLYQVFTAYMALGDRAAAERALDFLLEVQQKEDGSFPQNSWLDGKPFWGSLQLDEVAFPLIMAYQLGKTDKQTYEKHLKKAADFIVRTGPSTPQERWEEEGGYSPSTIAAEIAGLVCAAEIARLNGDLDSAEKYLKTADDWESNIEKWTATTTGKYGDGNYYLRITQNGKPDAGDKVELNNGSGEFDEREIVDAGFLELVRLGIRPADDPLIAKSVKIIDQVIKVETPNGAGFYRYNHDGYGEMDDGRRWNWDGKYTGKGRLWALLSGERGQYELALASSNNDEKSKTAAVGRLEAMQKFANGGLMIPEQVWDRQVAPEADSQFSPNLQFGEGTGSATSLAWSMAQFIRLAVNLQEGRNLDTPDIVYRRYAEKRSAENREEDPCEFARSFIPNGSGVLGSTSQDRLSPVIFPGRDGDPPKLLFSYTGSGKSVEIAGDFTGWKPCGMKFHNAQGSRKYFVLSFPDTARIEYKLIVDDQWITDPLNPNKINNGVGGENSVIEMPGYQPSSWARQIAPSPLNQEVSELEIDSSKFGRRTVKIYLPSEYFRRGIAPKLPVLYLLDGSDYLTRASAINVLENLVAAKKLEPFMLVFTDPNDRMKEYWASDDFADYIANEVVPAVERKYFTTIKTGRENRALLGASLGGITSIWTGLRHADTFANIGGQSSSFWVDDERVVKELMKLKGDEDINFYLDDGVFEGVEDTQRVVKLLREKGFSVTYVEGVTGHNWTSWRDRLADAFVALWKARI